MTDMTGMVRRAIGVQLAVSPKRPPNCEYGGSPRSGTARERFPELTSHCWNAETVEHAQTPTGARASLETLWRAFVES